ncbi:hypothetical protein AAMO2058_000617000 [Amorphochlora amoebiformis]
MSMRACSVLMVEALIKAPDDDFDFMKYVPQRFRRKRKKKPSPPTPNIDPSVWGANALSILLSGKPLNSSKLHLNTIRSPTSNPTPSPYPIPHPPKSDLLSRGGEREVEGLFGILKAGGGGGLRKRVMCDPIVNKTCLKCKRIITRRDNKKASQNLCLKCYGTAKRKSCISSVKREAEDGTLVTMVYNDLPRISPFFRANMPGILISTQNPRNLSRTNPNSSKPNQATLSTQIPKEVSKNLQKSPKEIQKSPRNLPESLTEPWCPTCGKRFQTLASTKRHVKLRHEQIQKGYTCGNCNKSFSERSDLVTHMAIHTGELPYVCKICSMRFRWRYQRIAHRNQVHSKSEESYICELCNNTFTSRLHLRRHVMHHLEVKDMKKSLGRIITCECGQSYDSKDELFLHIKKHQIRGENEIALRTARKADPGRKILSCQHCQRIFFTSGGLHQHEIREHSTRSSIIGHHLCTFPGCTKKLRSYRDLEAHNNTHYNRKPHRCDICGISFAALTNLCCHRKTRHFEVHIGGNRPLAIQKKI